MPKETPGISFPLDITGKNSGYDLADIQDVEWFKTEQERDQAFKETEDE